MDTQNEQRDARREALMRALALVRRYQNDNWRRLGVNSICSDLQRLIKNELTTNDLDASAHCAHIE